MHTAELLSPKVSLNALTRHLVRQGVRIDRWGCGQARRVPDLWDEVRRGDCRLTVAPLVRLVEVARARVYHPGGGGLQLIELQQWLPDGRSRTRLQCLAEKVRPGESALAALTRGLREELGAANLTRVRPESSRMFASSGSRSYPGMTTEYRIHQFDVTIAGLPDDDFVTEDLAGGAARWGWREVSCERGHFGAPRVPRSGHREPHPERGTRCIAGWRKGGD